jgi:hypothetical protein
MEPRTDSINWHAHARVDKFTVEQFDALAERLGRKPLGPDLKEHIAPYDSVESDGNLLTRQGLKRIMDRLVGTASNQALDSTHTRIGVGDDATAAAATQTDLQAGAGSTHRQFELVDAVGTVGTGASSGVVTFVATFESADANFAWAEWGIDGGTADGTTVTTEGNTTPGLINRKVSSLGTKTSAAVWVFTVTITIT